MKLHCIVCELEVENLGQVISGDANIVQPLAGTAFRTYGHYGSTIFDPMDGSYLDIVLCDTCLTKRIHYTHENIDQQIAEANTKHKTLINEELLSVLEDIENSFIK